MVMVFIPGQTSENWVRTIHKFVDSHQAVKALKDHFAGEGNATRNISEFDRFKESLHYKSKRACRSKLSLLKIDKSSISFVKSKRNI